MLRLAPLLALVAFAAAIVHRAAPLDGPSPSNLPYETRWYTQQLDHFNFQEQRTYQERYLYADQYWGTQAPVSSECKGPILFYTGNEGDIAWFYNNTGFVTEALAPQLGGLVIFAEHRYYGQSLPFGNSSFLPSNLDWFTTEQALADYAQLLTALKAANSSLAACPVIAFGGSYGGMLAGWFRLKYPNIVAGAIAASAPVLQFYTTGVSQWVYAEVTTNTFASADASCPTNVLKASLQMEQLGASASGLAQLTKTYSLCAPLTNYQDLYQWVSGGLQYLAMADYPYPANFLAPMPGNPVSVFCAQMKSALGAGASPVAALASAIGVYYNYTGQAGTCYDVNSSGNSNLGANGWDYQACTEMVMPISYNGTSDMFLPQPFDLNAQIAYCQYTYKATPRPLWVPTFYGANASQLAGGSNIFWSNGNLDPWSGGGVRTAPSPSQIAYLIEGGAHHLDLRTPNPLDPVGVIAARVAEVASINEWIMEWVGNLNAQRRAKN